MQAEGASSLEELKEKVKKSQAKEDKPAMAKPASTTPKPAPAKQAGAEKPTSKPQAAADRAGIKPLGDILNLDIINAAPHPTSYVSSLWQAYHSAHPTLSPTFLSASIPPATYASMLKVAQTSPVFILPLPREQEKTSEDGIKSAYEMFFLQWTVHPTPSVSPSHHAPHQDSTRDVERLPASSVMFTPLEEFKANGEWAKPYLVLTHYPDLHNNPTGTPRPPEPTSSESVIKPTSQGNTMVKTDGLAPQHHPVILMRGEISPAPTKSNLTNPLPSDHLALTRAEAQLLALGLQRFYCSTLEPTEKMSEQEQRDQAERAKLVKTFGKDPEWDWRSLSRLAFGGIA